MNTPASDLVTNQQAIQYRHAARGARLLFLGMALLASFNPVPAIAQGATAPARVVLYDEDPAEPKGRQYVGAVVWSTEALKGAGLSDDIAVHADVEIPERNFKMTLSLKRNLDRSLPATHTIDLKFDLPPNFAGGGVANVPGILTKNSEQARGVPLAGLSVKVANGMFLVGLSDIVGDRVRNMQMLQERTWLDIPLVYLNQRRAILAIEKGPDGEQAFKAALKAWGPYPRSIRTLPEPPPPSPPEGGGNYLVQVSSQRTEADALASYRVLQRKYPDLLGSREPAIRQIDLNATGRFYRVMVGPFQSSDDASQFCNGLKAAGGQCVVQRN